MDRRSFLKSLGKVCGAAVIAPAVLLKGRPEHVYVINHPSFGVSDKDLRELIDATLKDLPEKRWSNYFYNGIPT